MWRFIQFLKDSGGWGLTSTLATLFVYLIGLYEHFQGNTIAASILLALTVPLFWIGAYISWSKKDDELNELKKQLQEFPKIKQVPGSFKCDARTWREDHQGKSIIDVRDICSLVAKFKNDPQFHGEKATAKDVIALTSFFNIDVEQSPRFLFTVNSRWATNPEPKPKDSNKDILGTDIRIGETVELDIAVKYLLEDDAFAVTNEGYGSHALRHPKFQLDGNRFLAVVRLMAVNIKETFEFRFENAGQNGSLKPII
jgi:hypothetical protein